MRGARGEGRAIESEMEREREREREREGRLMMMRARVGRERSDGTEDCFLLLLLACYFSFFLDTGCGRVKLCQAGEAGLGRGGRERGEARQGRIEGGLRVCEGGWVGRTLSAKRARTDWRRADRVPAYFSIFLVQGEA